MKLIKNFLDSIKNHSILNSREYDNNQFIYFNLKDVIGLFSINRTNKMAPNDYIYGFNVMFLGNTYLSIQVETEVDAIPPQLIELRDLFIHNMGLSFIQVDKKHFKDIKFTFRTL